MNREDKKANGNPRAFIIFVTLVFMAGVIVGCGLGRYALRRELRARGYEIVYPTREPWYVATTTPVVWATETATPVVRATATITPMPYKGE